MSDLFIIGSSQPETAVGNQLREAANDLGLKAQLFEIADGHGTGLSRRLTYKFLGDYPLRGRAFNIRILDALRDQKPRYLLHRKGTTFQQHPQSSARTWHPDY